VLTPLVVACGPDGLVFAAPDGRPFSPSTANRRADRAWTAAELEEQRITLHEGRHTFATMMIASGSNAKEIQSWMRHASITETFDTYGKLFKGAEDEARERVDAYLARVDGEGSMP
jgi:integrase